MMFLPVEGLNFNLRSSGKFAISNCNNLYGLGIDSFGEESEFVDMRAV